MSLAYRTIHMYVEGTRCTCGVWTPQKIENRQNYRSRFRIIKHAHVLCTNYKPIPFIP